MLSFSSQLVLFLRPSFANIAHVKVTSRRLAYTFMIMDGLLLHMVVFIEICVLLRYPI